MAWNDIPEHIKKIAAKKPLPKDEIEPLKIEIKRYTEDYLNLKKGQNSLANLSGIIRNDFKVVDTSDPFEADVAGRLMRTRNYTMREGKDSSGRYEVFVIAADRDPFDKYRAEWTIGLTLFAFFTGFFGDVAKDKFFLTKQDKDTVQVKVLSMPKLSDTTIQINLQEISRTDKKDSIEKKKQILKPSE